MAYANGRIPDGELVTIPGGARLLAPVAAIWLAVRAEVARLHGWTPVPTGPLDGYRPLDGNYYAQHETFMRRYQPSYTQYATGKVDARKYNGITFYRKRGEDAAAVPGTSNHGWACAIDVSGLGGNATRYAQFAAVAIRHGLSNTEGLSVGEKWHWTHPGTVTQVKRGTTFPGAVPHVPSVTTPAPLEEIDMTPDQDRMLREVHAALGAGGAVGLPADDTVLGHTRALGAAVEAVPTRVWDAPVTADDGSGAQTHSAARWFTVMAFRVRDLITRGA